MSKVSLSIVDFRRAQNKLIDRNQKWDSDDILLIYNFLFYVFCGCLEFYWVEIFRFSRAKFHLKRRNGSRRSNVAKVLVWNKKPIKTSRFLPWVEILRNLNSYTCNIRLLIDFLVHVRTSCISDMWKEFSLSLFWEVAAEIVLNYISFSRYTCNFEQNFLERKLKPAIAKIFKKTLLNIRVQDATTFAYCR